MAGNFLNSPAQRIGVTKGAILKHAIPVEVLGGTGTNHDMAKNTGDTVKFRRWLGFGGATTNATTINQWVVDPVTHQSQEGVTPLADRIEPQDITVQLRQYIALYYYTDFVADLYEDDVPRAAKEIIGERMGLVREKIRYGALKGCTNKFYAGGTSRATVDGKITLNTLRKVSRSLKGNRGQMVREVLDASPKFNTAPVEPAFVVYVHTDAESDIRNLEGFIPTAAYGSRKLIHQMEIGSCESFRFVVSPELNSIPDAGASVTGTGLVSTSGTSIDIYPFIMLAKDAWGDVALRGARSFDINHLKPGQIDKSDPAGQRGYVSAKFWSAAFVQNDGWMAVAEAGVTDLAA